MNGRSGWFNVGLVLLLLVLLLMQWLLMMQSDRLFERVNRLEQRWAAGGGAVPTARRSVPTPGEGESEPVDGDWLVHRIGTDPSTLNPITSSDAVASTIQGEVFESFLRRDLDTLELVPLLAESYEMSDDGLELWFRLRDDIRFSDGEPVTADDVVFTFETIKNPGVDAAHLANYYQMVERVEKINDLEVRFYLSERYFKSLEMVGGMQILPRHIYRYDEPAEFNAMSDKLVGSGPYVFNRWQRGREIVLERNGNYWGELPHLERIIYRVITNDVASVQAMRAGEVDFMSPLPEQFVELCGDADFTSRNRCLEYWTPANGYFYIGWNHNTPFFNDRRVRLAMTLMIDREAIIRELLQGIGEIPTGPFSARGLQADLSIQPWPYDPVEAARLLDEAGWIDTDGDGLRDKLIDTTGDGVGDKRQAFRFRYMIVSDAGLHERIVRLVKDAAAGLGIEVIPDPYEWSVFVGRLHEGRFEATNLAWSGSIESDPYQIWHSSQIGGGSNYIGFRNVRADEIIEEARRTLDTEARNALYHEFHSLLHNEQPYTFVYTRPTQRFLHKRFHNVVVHRLGLEIKDWYVPLELQRY